MNDWRVKLEGEPFDLQELARWIPNGEVHVVEVDDVYYIAGTRFGNCTTADEAREAADLALRELYGLVRVCGSRSKLPNLSHIQRLRQDGGIDIFISIAPEILRISGSVGQTTPPPR